MDNMRHQATIADFEQTIPTSADALLTRMTSRTLLLWRDDVLLVTLQGPTTASNSLYGWAILSGKTLSATAQTDTCDNCQVIKDEPGVSQQYLCAQE